MFLLIYLLHTAFKLYTLAIRYTSFIFAVLHRLCCLINDYPSLKVSNYKLKTYNVP